MGEFETKQEYSILRLGLVGNWTWIYCTQDNYLTLDNYDLDDGGPTQIRIQ